jgi:hypothetical protein
MLAGAAGAPLVPWRGVIEPLIVLPNALKVERYVYEVYGAPSFAIDPALAEELDYDEIGRRYAQALAESFAQTQQEALDHPRIARLLSGVFEEEPVLSGFGTS